LHEHAANAFVLPMLRLAGLAGQDCAVRAEEELPVARADGHLAILRKLKARSGGAKMRWRVRGGEDIEKKDKAAKRSGSSALKRGAPNWQSVARPSLHPSNAGAA
jgi:hypothetical protein